MAKRGFGELESQILHILQGKERMTVKEVHHTLGGADNYNTVMTVMNRLVEKRVIARERSGLQYEYWVLDRSKNVSFLEKCKKKLFGVRTSPLVSYLIESADDITEEDFIAMEKTLEKVKLRRQKL